MHYQRKYTVRCWLFLLCFIVPHIIMAQAKGIAAKDIDNQDFPPITGKPIWKESLGGQVIGLPSVQAGSVVVVCEGGNVKAFSREGHFLWHYAADGKLSPFITRSREGTNYICRTNGNLIAVNRIGRELWNVNIRSPLAGPILSGWDGRIFVPTEKTLFCYTGAGNLLWYKNLESPIAVGPREDRQGGLIMVLSNGELLHINSFGKTSITQLPTVPAMVVSLAGSQEADPLLNLKRQETEVPILILYKNGELEISGGAEYPAMPKLPAQPKGAASRHDNAVIALSDGRVVLLSCATGKTLWTARSGITPDESGEAGNETAMIYDERGIYMLSKSGAAGFTEDGQRLWFIKIIGAAAQPIFSEEGLLYSGGTDWTLYAYRLENRILPRRQSLYGPAPEGNYGLDALRPSRRSDYTNRFREADVIARLNRINKAIREGRVGEEEKDYTAYLMEVAGSVRNSLKVSATHPPVQIRERVEAVRLLSYLGSQEIIPFLADLFINDPDSQVKAACAEAIGRIGIDLNGLALEAFAQGISLPAQTRDEQVLKAVTSAVGSLCRFSGPPLGGIGIKLLIALAGQDRPLAVRVQAMEEIKALRQ